MSRELHLTGMVLQSAPFGDYDRRVILLTKERGKITAFARGARRPNSPLLAATGTFHTGTFYLYEGRSAYTLAGAAITEYYQGLKTDLEGSFFGAYFMELAAYYGRENLEASAMLNLLYVSLKALENPAIPNPLVRCVFEIRLMVIGGEYPQQNAIESAQRESTRYAIQYAISAPLGRLYTFNVTQEVLEEMVRIQEPIRKRTIDARLKSLEILQEMGMA